MVYWVDTELTRMQLSVFQRQSADDEGEWRITARTRGQVDDSNHSDVLVSEWADTRAKALEGVERTWLEQCLPRLDWRALTQLLVTLQAL